jgi:hypothetical protein
MPTQHAEDEDDGRGYPLAPEEVVGVSSAEACDAKLAGQKREAVKGYLRTLGPALREKYGPKPHYSPERVRQTALERALSIDYLCWAFVIHCALPDFERIHAAAGEACDYFAMREVVGAAFFGGNADFVASQVTEALVSGAAAAAAGGAGGVPGCLGDVDWTGLLDWS